MAISRTKMESLQISVRFLLEQITKISIEDLPDYFTLNSYREHEKKHSLFQTKFSRFAFDSGLTMSDLEKFSDISSLPDIFKDLLAVLNAITAAVQEGNEAVGADDILPALTILAPDDLILLDSSISRLELLCEFSSQWANGVSYAAITWLVACKAKKNELKKSQDLDLSDDELADFNAEEEAAQQKATIEKTLKCPDTFSDKNPVEVYKFENIAKAAHLRSAFYYQDLFYLCQAITDAATNEAAILAIIQLAEYCSRKYPDMTLEQLEEGFKTINFSTMFVKVSSEYIAAFSQIQGVPDLSLGLGFFKFLVRDHVVKHDVQYQIEGVVRFIQTDLIPRTSERHQLEQIVQQLPQELSRGLQREITQFYGKPVKSSEAVAEFKENCQSEVARIVNKIGSNTRFRELLDSFLLKLAKVCATVGGKFAKHEGYLLSKRSLHSKITTAIKSVAPRQQH